MATTQLAVPSTTQALTTSVPLDVPGLLVAGSGGIIIDTPDGLTRVLKTPVRLAVPDLEGGVVYQLTATSNPIDIAWDDDVGRYRYVWEEGTAPEPIRWLQDLTGDPRVVVDHPEGVLRLVDVVLIGDEPHILYRLRVPGPVSTHETEPGFGIVEHLLTKDLHTGTNRTFGIIGAWESSGIDIRIGGDRVALGFNLYPEGPGYVGVFALTSLLENPADEWVIDPCGGFELTCADYGPAAECPEGRFCYGWVTPTITSDGSRLAWVGQSSAGDPGADNMVKVVSVDLTTGLEDYRVVLPSAAYFDSISAYGEWTVISSAHAGEAFLIGRDGSVTALSHDGTITVWQP